MKLAVTGASGFIGNRVIEKFHLGNVHEVIPLVHSNWSLALPARFNLPWKVCDHFSVKDLTKALDGCETILHAGLAGPYDEMAEAVYRAADQVGARRLVFLSSASIYNQDPEPGITEESPLPRKPAFPYNAEKIAADKKVRKLRARGKAEIVFLLPGIVYGPRSRWIAKLAEQIGKGTANLIGGGDGIFNGIYVDNLVVAVELALRVSHVDGESFFVSDAETVTWRDFYMPVVEALGTSVDDLHCIEEAPITGIPARERVRARILATMDTKRAQTVKPLVPDRLKKFYKDAMSFSLTPPPPPDPLGYLRDKQPEVTQEMIRLQRCAYKLPNTKAERLLHYFAPVTFAQGMKRSISWLKFAGYPIVA